MEDYRPRLVNARRRAPCMTCKRMIEKSEACYWEPDVGSWHQDCAPPANLAEHIRKRDLYNSQPVRNP